MPGEERMAGLARSLYKAFICYFVKNV